MSDTDKKNDDLLRSTSEPESSFPDNEIDDFAKALLAKKTEIALYEEVMSTTDPLEIQLGKTEVSSDEKTRAEDSMAEALDELRRERGQLPINKEEANFVWSQSVVFEDRFEGEEDFTTASLFHVEKPSEPEPDLPPYTSLDKRNYIEETEKRPIEPVKKKSRADRNARNAEGQSMKGVVVPTITDNSPQTAQTAASTGTAVVAGQEAVTKEKPENKEVIQSVYLEDQKEGHSRRWIAWACLLIAVLLGGMGGYYFITHTSGNTAEPVITEAQKQAYDDLVKIADSYLTMSASQKEKLEETRAQYNELSDEQKKELDSLFREKTGKTYDQLLAAAASASKPASSKDEQDTDNETNTPDSNKEPASSPLPSQTPAQTPSQEPSQTPSSGTVPGDSSSQGQTPKPDNSAQIAQYEQEIAQLQADKSNYVDFLTSEGLPTSDEITAGYDSQIAYYQNLLNALR